MTRQMRKFILFTHILASVSWIGADLVMGVLSFRGLVSDDPQTVATAYGALTMFCVPLLLTLGLLSLTTGVILGLGTRFGLLRYWWVATKLTVNLVLTTLVLVALQPTLSDASTEVATMDPSLPDRLSDVSRNMIFPPIVSTSLLLFAAWLSVYKPWGPTPYGRRFLRVPARDGVQERSSG
jgi:hypothetical protein